MFFDDNEGANYSIRYFLNPKEYWLSSVFFSCVWSNEEKQLDAWRLDPRQYVH